MVRKLAVLCLLTTVVLLWSALLGIRDTMDNAAKYGWNYELTETVNEKVISVKNVSTTSALVSCFAVFIFSMTSWFSFGALAQGGYVISHVGHLDTDNMGIEFGTDKPKRWDLWYDPTLRIIGVTINEFMIMVPLKLIHSWDPSSTESAKNC